MKYTWIITSIISAAIGAIVAFLLAGSWKLSMICFAVIVIIMLINDPKRRYMRAFWTLLTMILVLNKFFFKVTGELLGIEFKFGSEKAEVVVTISLIILTSITLILDFLERNKNQKGSIMNTNHNKIDTISGNNIIVNQKIKKSKTKNNRND